MSLSDISLELSPAKGPRVKMKALSVDDIGEGNLANMEMWSLTPIKNAPKRIHIISSNLRKFIYENTDTGLVPNVSLEQPSDGEATKRNRISQTGKPITEYFAHIETFSAFTETNFDSNSDVSYVDFKRFSDMLETERRLYSNEATRKFKEGIVDFRDLATYLNLRGNRVAVRRDEAELSFITSTAEIRSSMMGGVSLVIKGTIYTTDGEGIVEGFVDHRIPAFAGKKTLAELGITDLDSNPDDIKRLIERGRKYLKLTKSATYCNYSGMLVRRGWWFTNRFQANGRVMIDMRGMRNIDADYRQYLGEGEFGETQDTIHEDNITDDILMAMSPVVYGFSFIAKQWGEMLVDNIKDIVFNEDAFDKLVLEEDTKDLILSLVENDFSFNSDLIDGKGGGTIFLLEGSPGVGKTLSAEAVAEKLHRPLYIVGIGELGTDVVSLEESLSKILNIANSWNAVLLIDEADIFLAERNDFNVERNAMVGIFLRLLEYYPGFLFLTTNLAGSIDPAFFSRISMAIHYNDLTEDTRTQIWNNLLQKSNTKDIDVSVLSKYDINGRQIKNCIRNALALAHRAKRPPVLGDFERVINKSLEFQNSFDPTRKLEGK